MTTTQNQPPILRRLGDIIQGLAVIAIAGLVVVIIDLRITIVKNQDMINAQDKLYSQNFKSLKENIELQMKLLESIVNRVIASNFSVTQGIALQENVKLLYSKMENTESEIKKLYEKVYINLQQKSTPE
jgi:energy-converting hydrogenase Eha subunit H